MRAYIHNWDSLKHYGINCLTGEACGYNMRLLCDLTQEGSDLVSGMLGLKLEPFNPNWNRDAVGSVMLFRGMFDDICKYILFAKGFKYVVKAGNGTWAGYDDGFLETQKMTLESLIEITNGALYQNYSSTPRNTHAMTGRKT